MSLYMGLGVDGKIYSLGECEDFEAADQASEKLSIDCTWIFSEEDAKGYLDQIKHHLDNKPKPPMYNHMFDVAFSVRCEESDYEKVPENLLLDGLIERVRTLEHTFANEGKGSIEECFGHSDVYEEE